MKKFGFLALAMAVVLSLPAASYALVDASAYGGYAFGSRIEEEGTNARPAGAVLGVMAHYWGTVIPTALDLGIGAFYQRSFEQYSVSDIDYDSYRNIIGLSGYVELTLIPVVHPFVRATLNVWDSVDGSSYSSGTSYFTTYAVGGGIQFKILPVVSIFGEYLYTFGERAGSQVRGSEVHAGVRVKI